MGMLVMGGYWCEKIEMYSEQETTEFDPVETRKEIEREIESGLEEYGYKDGDLDDMKEYMERCLDNVDDYIDYLIVARDYPSCADYDCIVLVKTIKPWLKCIFDGFDEICKRLKENK